MRTFFMVVSILTGAGVLLRGIMNPLFFYSILALSIPFLSKWRRSYLLLFVLLGFVLAYRPAYFQNVEILGCVKNSPGVQVKSIKIWRNGEWRRLKGSFRWKRGDFGEGLYCLGDLRFVPGYPEYEFHGKCFEFPKKLGVFENFVLFIKKRIKGFKDMGEKTAPRITDMVVSKKKSDVYRSGLTHLFVVSGFHMGLVFLIFRSILGFFTAKKYVLDFSALIPTFLYLTAVGFSPSAFRAFLMITIRTVFKAVDYPVHPLNVVGLSAFASILIDPWIVTSPSFLMSHAAVAGILLGLEVKRNTFLLTLSAFLMSLPFSLLFFGTLNPISPLLSFLALPVASLAVFTGISSMMFYVLGFEFLSSLLMRGSYPLDKVLDTMIKLGNAFPRIEFYGAFNVILSFLTMILVLKVIASMCRV